MRYAHAGAGDATTAHVDLGLDLKKKKLWMRREALFKMPWSLILLSLAIARRCEGLADKTSGMKQF